MPVVVEWLQEPEERARLMEAEAQRLAGRYKKGECFSGARSSRGRTNDHDP